MSHPNEFPIDPNRDYSRFSTIREALKGIASGGVDSGMGMASADFWVTIDGVEFLVQVARSGKQLAIDGRSRGLM